MGNESVSGGGPSGMSSQTNASAVAQTANIGRSTSVTSGAAKVFREFKWGLLTLFLLMVVVIGLVYDGGRKKKPVDADLASKNDDRIAQAGLDSGPEPGLPPVTPPTNVVVPQPESPITGDLSAPPAIPSVPLKPGTGPTKSTGNTSITETPIKPGTTVPPPKSESAAGEKSYVVQSGDTLTSIATSQLPGKGGLKAILDANKDVLPNPNKLRVGMSLKIPGSIAAPAAKTETVPGKKIETAIGAKDAPKDAPKDGVKESHAASEYVVQSGDTLERIARKVLSDGRKWRDIYEWNRDSIPEPGRLHVGQVLKIKQGAANATIPSASGTSSRAEVIDEPVQTPAPANITRAKPGAPVANTNSEQPQVMSSTSGAIFP